jgi:hypothetical protein
MPLQLISPIYKTFILEDTDVKYKVEDGENTTVTIKQAAQFEHEQRQDLFSVLERKYKELTPDEITLVQRISMEELKRLETYLTLVECNIKDVEGKELFPSKKAKGKEPVLAMRRDAFEHAWGSLPPDVCIEIHGKVLEVNKLWAGLAGED